MSEAFGGRIVPTVHDADSVHAFLSPGQAFTPLRLAYEVHPAKLEYVPKM